MKELAELNLPDDVQYAQSHEWVKKTGSAVRVGIDDYAQDQLGDIVFVELPRVGDTLHRGEQFGTVESVKAVAELFLPVGGRILSVNTGLEESPGLVNQSPYEDGWMVEIDPEDTSEMEALMDGTAYLETLKGLR